MPLRLRRSTLVAAAVSVVAVFVIVVWIAPSRIDEGMLVDEAAVAQRIRELIRELAQARSFARRAELVEEIPRAGAAMQGVCLESYQENDGKHVRMYLASILVRLGESAEGELGACATLFEICRLVHRGERPVPDWLVERFARYGQAAFRTLEVAYSDPDPLVRDCADELACSLLPVAVDLAERGEEPFRSHGQAIFTEMALRLRQVAGEAWDLEPDRIEELFRGEPRLVDRLMSPALREPARELATFLEKLARSRGEALLKAAKDADDGGDLVAQLSSTDRAFDYGAVPDRGLLTDLFLYYRVTCRKDELETRALRALRSEKFGGDRDTLTTIAGDLRSAHLDAAVEAYVKAAKASPPKFRTHIRRSMCAALRKALGPLAPGEDFARLLAEGQAQGYLKVARAFREEGELLAAASSLEKAALVPSEREEAFRMLADIYGAMGDDDAVERTLSRARKLGIAIAAPARGRHGSPMPGRVAWVLDRPQPHVYLNHLRAGRMLIEGVRRYGLAGHSALLWGIDAETGRLAWELEPKERPVRLGQSGLQKGYTGHRGLALCGERLIWDVFLGCMVSGSGYGWGHAGYEMDPASGEVLGKETSPCPRLRSGMVQDGEGRILVGTKKGCLIAIDIARRRRLWRVDLHPGRLTSYRTRVHFHVQEDVVAAGGATGWVVLARLADGGELWRRRLPGEVSAAPFVSDERVFFGTLDGFIWALDRQSGETLWEKRIPLWPCAFTGHGNRLYVLSNDGDLYLLDAESGRTTWQRRLGGMSRTGSLVLSGRTLYAFPGVGSDGTLYTTEDHFVHALDAETGRSIWAVPTERVVAGRATPIVERERIFLAGSDTVLCIRTDDGAPDLLARVRTALEVARRFEEAGELHEAALAAAEASDRIDQGSIELMAAAARLSTLAGLGPFAVRRMERWSGALFGSDFSLSDEQKRLLREQVSLEEEGAFRAAVVLARAGLWNEHVERAIREGVQSSSNKWQLRKAGLRAWVARAEPGTVEAELTTNSDLLLVGLVHRSRGERRGLQHLSAGKGKPRARTIGVVGARSDGPAKLARPTPERLPNVGRQLLSEVVVPVGGEFARDIFIHNLGSAPPTLASEFAHMGVPGVRKALAEKLRTGDKGARKGAAKALARLGAQEFEEYFLENLDGLPGGLLADLGARGRVPELLEIARTPGEPRREAALKELVLLLSEKASPMLVELYEADVEEPGEDSWRRTMLRAAYKVGTREMLPLVLHYGLGGTYMLGSTGSAFVREHATAEDLRPHLAEMFSGLGKSWRNLYILDDLRGVLGPAVADEAGKLLHDPEADSDAVLGALEALGHVGRARDVPALVQLARAPATAAKMRRSAIYALLAIPGEEAEQALRELHDMKGGEPAAVQCRELATLGLAVRGDLSAVMEAARLHFRGHDPAKRDAWVVFAICFARETESRGGGTYAPSSSYVREGTDARQALRWTFYLRDLTSPEERLKPFGMFGLEFKGELRPQGPRAPSPRPPSPPEEEQEAF